jgi:DNA-binding response OmpR family regulator
MNGGTTFLPKPYTLHTLLARAEAMTRQGRPDIWCQESD